MLIVLGGTVISILPIPCPNSSATSYVTPFILRNNRAISYFAFKSGSASLGIAILPV